MVIMLAGEKEKMPVEFCGDAVKIVCCEPPAVDRTKHKILIKLYKRLRTGEKKKQASSDPTG